MFFVGCIEHLTSPLFDEHVRFQQSVRAAWDDIYRIFLEVGLVKRELEYDLTTQLNTCLAFYFTRFL